MGSTVYRREWQAGAGRQGTRQAGREQGKHRQIQAFIGKLPVCQSACCPNIRDKVVVDEIVRCICVLYNNNSRNSSSSSSSMGKAAAAFPPAFDLVGLANINEYNVNRMFLGRFG